MFDREGLYYRASHPKSVAGLRTLVEQSKVTIGLPDVEELDWDESSKPGADVEVVGEPDRDFIPPGRDYVLSDTGELSRNWVEGFQAINTKKTQAAHGWIGGRAVSLDDVSLRIETSKAAVALCSLDDQPIRESKRVLITAVARVVASPGGQMPLLSEPVRGQLVVHALKGLKLVPLAGDGTPLEPVPAPYDGDAYTIKLPAPRGTHWFLLTDKP
jgi:hypothetical protein